MWGDTILVDYRRINVMSNQVAYFKNWLRDN